MQQHILLGSINQIQVGIFDLDLDLETVIIVLLNLSYLAKH